MLRMHFQRLLTLLILVVLSTGSAFSSDKPLIVSDYTADEALKFGERMYREGILPSGKSMKAIVMGDIPVDGRMFTCDDCHQRSGLGSVEGTVITWPTNGKELYQPRRRTGAYRPPGNDRGKGKERRTLPKYFQVEDVRPAYTDASLAHVMRSGIDPAGRKLDPVMPLFRLGKKNMDILVHYLKNLSVELSPGVDDTTLHFATVIDVEVPEREKKAMLSVLQAHIDARNSQTRHQERRAASGPFYKTEMHKAYRRLKLSIWELKGSEESWRGQLESYYRQEPVFALLGGISNRSWAPIHAFSEEHGIPSIFPITDFPAISESDWYTLYFSKGYYQEGESAAKYVRARLGVEGNNRIVQVFRQDRPGAALARGFEETWRKLGGSAPENIIFKGNEDLAGRLSGLPGIEDPAVLLLWLDREDGSLFRELALQLDREKMIFTSATLLQNDFFPIGGALRDSVYVTFPYNLPQDYKKRRTVVERWLQARHIPLTDFTIQAKMYFLGWMLPGALKNMRSEFFREYFLEGYDMMTDQDYAIAVYPRLSFGSGQRYASKGCYIVKLSKGSDPALLPVNDWVTY